MNPIGLPLIFLVFLTQTDKVLSFAKEVNHRLSGTVIPYHYDIEIKTYLLQTQRSEKTFTFDGVTKIIVGTKTENVTSIILHATDLEIHRTELKMENSTDDSTPVDVSLPDYETEQITVNFNQPLTTLQNYTLIFTYSGKMENKQLGFFRSGYYKNNSEVSWYGLTQLEPLHARKVFPCFDEPKFKATFNISINRENAFRSLSNTNLSHTISFTSEQRTIDVYKTTPIMSTYLVAFIIFDFKPQIFETKNFTIWASKSDSFKKMNFAYEFTPKILKLFDNYTGIPYQNITGIKKLDLVAVPEFGRTSVASWGLIADQESFLSYEPDLYGLNRKDIVAMCITNKIAHMWFGNLVTVDWWSHTWLTEGFATFWEYYASNEIFPEFELDKQFVTDRLQAILREDALPQTGVLTDNTVKSHWNITKMFGSLTYSKGACFIRMLASIFGPSKFHQALAKYFNMSSYKTVTPDNLIGVLTPLWHNKDLDFKEFFLQWTELPGYPLVTAELSADRKSIKFTQKRFKTEGNEEWIIPITYTTSTEKKFTDTYPIAYLQGHTELFVALDGKVDWLIVNIQQVGYYRVNYDTENWQNIVKALKSENFGGIDEISRSQIIDDVSNLIDAGILEYKFIFEVLQYLQNEYSYTPWNSASYAISSILSKISKEDRVSFVKYILELVNNVYEKLGFYPKSVDEKPLVSLTRNIVRNLACMSGHKDCMAEAKSVFDNSIQDPKKTVPFELSVIVYCTTVEEYGEKYSKYLRDLYKAEGQIIYLTSQACTKDTNEFENLLDYILNNVTLIERPTAFLKLTSVDNVGLIFNYITKNYDKFTKAFSTKGDALMIMGQIASNLSTHKQYNKVKQFFNDHKSDFEDTQAVVESTLESIQSNIDFSKRHSKYFKEYRGENSGCGLKTLQNNALKLILLITSVLIFIY